MIAVSDHNYDRGSLFMEGDLWRVMGPTGKAPQRYGTGGEVELWTSRDEGVTWRMEKQVTRGSRFNHSYVRRPEQASDPFAAFWADGSPASITESHLYFADREGNHVWELPYDMGGGTAVPRELD
jgi:hypothetical protein